MTRAQSRNGLYRHIEAPSDTIVAFSTWRVAQGRRTGDTLSPLWGLPASLSEYGAAERGSRKVEYATLTRTFTLH